MSPSLTVPPIRPAQAISQLPDLGLLEQADTIQRTSSDGVLPGLKRDKRVDLTMTEAEPPNAR
jgi:hypothetical protein